MSSRRTTRVLACLVAMSLIPPAAALAADPAQLPVERVAGETRFDTAARLALASADGGTPDRVWLATGRDYPDALAAAATGEPVLLTERDALPAPTADALARLAPTTVAAVGGTRVLSQATLSEAGRVSGADTVRHAGADRFATAVAISIATRPDGADTVWIATGEGFPDALAAGPVAAADDAPLLLVAPDDLPARVRDELVRLSPSTIVVAGGPEAVSETVARAAADAADATVVRLSGDDRYATAVEIADRAVAEHGMVARPHLATGTDFPDALAAGAAALADDGPMLLVTRTEVPEPTRRWLLDHVDTLDALRVVGGTVAVSDTVLHRASRPWLTGSCDLYDISDSTPIQGHPENQQPQYDALTGPWTIDTFRDGWSMAVPTRWRQDKVEAFEHRGVLFYVDTEDGYDHWLSVTVFCGNPFLMGKVVLDAQDPRQIAEFGPHGDDPTIESFDGPALYSAEFRGSDESTRFDYVAVEDDVILIHYRATNRFAQQMDGRVDEIADRVAASVAAAGEAECPPIAADCRRR